METDPTDRIDGMRRTIQDDQLVRDDTQRGIGLRALEAFIEAPNNEPPSPECLNALALAVRCSEFDVSVSGAELLRQLAGIHEVARDAIRGLVNEADENTRFSAICAASDKALAAIGFTEEIMRVGLRDKSEKVRTHTAAEVFRLSLGCLAQDLLQASLFSIDDDEREWLEIYAGILMDGYKIAPAADWEREMFGLNNATCKVYVRVNDSDVIRGFVTPHDLEQQAAVSISTQIAKNYYRQQANLKADPCWVPRSQAERLLFP
jgi:hypothetical protein